MSNIQDTLNERGNRYGDFTDHAAIAQGLQKVMQRAQRKSPVIGNDARPLAWDCLTDVQRQALTVIADKIARILSGDPNYADNWHDIQGYAQLVEERLPATVAVRNDSAPVGPTIAELVEAGHLPPAHPAWPENKAYRWMAQDQDGSWWAYTEKPVAGRFREWQCIDSSEFVRMLQGQANPNWRDTLIERGADE